MKNTETFISYLPEIQEIFISGKNYGCYLMGDINPNIKCVNITTNVVPYMSDISLFGYYSDEEKCGNKLKTFNCNIPVKNKTLNVLRRIGLLNN